MEEETLSTEMETNRLMRETSHQPSFTDSDLFSSDSSGTEASAPTPLKKLTFVPMNYQAGFKRVTHQTAVDHQLTQKLPQIHQPLLIPTMTLY